MKKFSPNKKDRTPKRRVLIHKSSFAKWYKKKDNGMDLQLIVGKYLNGRIEILTP